MGWSGLVRVRARVRVRFRVRARVGVRVRARVRVGVRATKCRVGWSGLGLAWVAEVAAEVGAFHHPHHGGEDEGEDVRQVAQHACSGLGLG